MIHLREPADGPLGENRLEALTGHLFEPRGWLEDGLGLEHRPQQAGMAERVASAFAADEPLLFEAGTGVGKSLAYLLPGLIHGLSAERPLLVSTHTRALQEQIRAMDLELCRKVFSQTPQLAQFSGFKVAKLVGRGNYLCTTRLARALSSPEDLFPGEKERELARIAEWSAQSTEGLYEELSPPPSPEVWEWLNADSSVCSRKNCEGTDCFYRKALKARDAANVIIVNHSLLFALIGAGMTPGRKAPGVLLPNDFVVLDEAHRVPEVATEYFGDNLSSFALTRLLRQLYNPKRKKGKGLLARLGGRRDTDAVMRCEALGEAFFEEVRERYLVRKDLARLHEPDWAEPPVLPAMDDLLQRIGAVLSHIDEQNQRDEINDLRLRLNGFRAGLAACLALKEEDHVYWAEKAGRQGRVTHLRSAPLAVGPHLRHHLFERGTSVVLTSATLSCGDAMATFRERTGADAIDGTIVTSPFDYERNVRVFVAEDAPAPGSVDSRLDAGYLADQIAFCAAQLEGGTLVLFTSFADLGRVGRLLGSEYELDGRLLLQQGAGTGREQMLRDFREAGNAVLLGTETFWTGVDVPGPALSQVIIARLPFENPTHPVAQARAERLRALGRNPFASMTLPDALIKLRQGVGRLIRRQSDTGRIVILDSRVLKQSYGRAFLEVLPVERHERFSRHNREHLRRA